MDIFRTIRARIALLITILMLIVLSAAGTFLYVSLRVQLQQALDDGLRLSAEQLLTTIENENGRPVFGRGDAQRAQFSGEDDLVRLVSPDGQIALLRGSSEEFSFSGSFGSDIQFITLSEEGEVTSTAESLTTRVLFGNGQSDENQMGNYQAGSGNFGERLTALFGSNLNEGLRLISLPVVIEGRQVAWLQVGRSTDPLSETLASLMSLLLVVAPLVLVATVGSGYWLAGRVLRPIEEIRRQADAIGVQDLSKRLNFALPNDEVGRLASTFDQMLARLEESFRNQQRFVSDASHELRTPLAIIRGEVDVALENQRPPNEYVASLRTIGGEAERMGRLVHGLLLLAQTDRAQLPLTMEQVDLADLLGVLVETIEPKSEAAGVEIELNLPLRLLITGDSDRLIQLFLNLLDNALIYAPGSRVSINGRFAKNRVVICIEDTGPGIAPEQLPHLFERFYRVDQARSRADGGSGLGLAIAQEIAHAHGGEIAVSSQLGKGTTFTVQLPISPL